MSTTPLPHGLEERAESIREALPFQTRTLTIPHIARHRDQGTILEGRIIKTRTGTGSQLKFDPKGLKLEESR
jgi:hypothetical protein